MARTRSESRTRGTKAEPDDGSAFACRLASALVDVKSEAVKVLDVRGLTDVADFLVIATAMSERQLAAMASAAAEAVESSGRTLLGTEGTGQSGWIVVDTGDVVTHLLSRPARAYYDLDGLWADAPVVTGPARGRKEPQ